MSKTKLAKKKTSNNKLQRGNDYVRLNALARQIREGHQATEQLIKGAKDKAKEALAEAILTGKALIEVKKILGFGKYERWLKEHCKTVSLSTCKRYVTLYNAFGQKSSHMSDLPITNLRKAYLQLGIINEPEEIISRPAPQLSASSPDATVATSDASSIETDTQTIDKMDALPTIDAEVNSPQAKPNNKKETELTDILKAIKLRTNALYIDLFNSMDGKFFTANELSAIVLDPMIAWFTANRTTLTPPPLA